MYIGVSYSIDAIVRANGTLTVGESLGLQMIERLEVLESQLSKLNGHVSKAKNSKTGANHAAYEAAIAQLQKIGVYDKWVARFAYADFPEGASEKAELEKIIQDGITKKYLFISDADTRPASAAHPLANLWDNGSDPVAELKHIMRVRKIGLSQFGYKNVPEGAALSLLENKLLPLYLHHRYQVTATAKTLGGVYYNYSVRKGDLASPNDVYKIVPAAKQRQALYAVIATLGANELVIPERILKILPPLAFGTGSVKKKIRFLITQTGILPASM